MASCSSLNLFEVALTQSNPSARSARRPSERAGLEPDQVALLPAIGAMNKQAPSTARILSMVAFAASCVGLLLFLWISFGGTIPFAAEGYRLSAEFNQAVELAPQSDIRISGVSIGKGRVGRARCPHRPERVRCFRSTASSHPARPTHGRPCAPNRCSARRFIELTPGTKTSPALPDGRRAPTGADRADRAAGSDPVHIRSGDQTRVRGLAAAVRDRA